MILATDILRQEAGHFDQRFGVGPAEWDFWDLLWVHEGGLQLNMGNASQRLSLVAPSGVLIPPRTPFRGRVSNGRASASITHFRSNSPETEYLVVPSGDRLHAQNLLQLSLDYARRAAPLPRRLRLLDALLDCFAKLETQVESHTTRLDRAWREAEEKLSAVRSIADVAAFSGQAESTFRAAHRAQFGSTAGQYLQNLRLSEAERCLACTGMGLVEIAQRVGYGHAETLSAAFKRSRGCPPGEFRRWCKRFA